MSHSDSRAGGSNYGHDDHTDSLAFFNGQEALDLANYMNAANNFTLLIERHPRDPQYRWLRARSYYGMRAWKLCAEDCQQAMALGLIIPQVQELLSLAAAEEGHQTNGDAGRPELLTLVNLRQTYKLRSLLISADEHLAEGDYIAVLSLITLAERLLDPTDLSSDLSLSTGLIRVRACIGAGKQYEALEAINFYIKHAHAAGRDSFVEQYNGLRNCLH